MNEEAAEIRTPLLDFHPPRCCLLASANLTSTNHKWTQSLWSEGVVWQRRCVGAGGCLRWLLAVHYPLDALIWNPALSFSTGGRSQPWEAAPVYNSSQPGRTLRTHAKRAFCSVKTRVLFGYLSIFLLTRWTGSLRATEFSMSLLLLSFLDMSGSHRKNSWRRVLTVSGHSIMTMWLPSSITFRKANRRIYK